MPRRKKTSKRKFEDIVRSDWDNILSEIEKKEIPIEMLEAVVVNFIDGSVVEIQIAELLEEGMDPNQIETRLNARLATLDSLIRDIDFHITKEKVISEIDAHTQTLLKNLG
jgi:hypothetical protein